MYCIDGNGRVMLGSLEVYFNNNPTNNIDRVLLLLLPRLFLLSSHLFALFSLGPVVAKDEVRTGWQK